MRLHSCPKREDALVRAAMRESREALIDRTPKPCHHKVANHQHGTNACYVLDKCRCTPCSRARAAHDDWRRRQQAYGRYQRYVPAGPVREHVRSLMDAGVGLKRIVKISGVSQGSLWKLMYGKRQADGTQYPSRRILRETAEKLYAIDPDWTASPAPLAAGAKDPAGTPQAKLHLRALVALGWSMSELGRRLGINYPGNACATISGDRIYTRATVEKAEALYAELSMTLPPETNQRERIAASRARRYAQEHGWLPPLALDDEPETVDLDAAPDIDEVAIQRRLAGDKTVRLSKAERLELVRIARDRGWSYRDLETRTGITKPERYVDRQEAS